MTPLLVKMAGPVCRLTPRFTACVSLVTWEMFVNAMIMTATHAQVIHVRTAEVV